MMHIGTARTALFNYLYAKHTGGKFLLRIEDTDRERSTEEAVQVILDGLEWLGLEVDGEPVFQATRADRHREVVDMLLASGHAYRDYMSADETEAWKLANKNKAFRSSFRDRTEYHQTNPLLRASSTMAELSGPFVVRFKGPTTGETVVHDLIKGDVTFNNETFDDLVLLRSDGTPTYNLAVVVDDHDMGITHVIRGDDHLNNAGRQKLIYEAMGWDVPAFAHLPLIFSEAGKKLTKRDGQTASVMDFADAGYLPETMRNYLARLGWGHGEAEIFSDAQAIEWFDVADVVSAPARMDGKKLLNMNHHYIGEADNERLAVMVLARFVWDNFTRAEQLDILDRLPGVIRYLKDGAHTIKELAELCVFAFRRPESDQKAADVLNEIENLNVLMDVSEMLVAKVSFDDWAPELLNNSIRDWAAANDIKMGKIGPVMRAALTGRTTAPDLGTLLTVIGREAAFARIVTQVQIRLPSTAGLDTQ